MGTGGTDALAKSGFSKDEIAAALDYCDNDRAKTLQYLKKQQCGKGGVKWQDALKTALPTMKETGTCTAKVKEYLQWMIEFDNVPLKPKPFKNFVKNSMALQRDNATVEAMWEHFEPLLKKKPAQTAPKASSPRASPRLAAAAKSPALSAKSEGKKRAAEEDEEAGSKKKKKAKKEDSSSSSSDSDSSSEEEEEEIKYDKAAKKEFKALKAKKKEDEGLSKKEAARFDLLKKAKAKAKED